MDHRGSIPWRYILPPSAMHIPAHISLVPRDTCQRGDLNPGALIPNVPAVSIALETGLSAVTRLEVDSSEGYKAPLLRFEVALFLA